MQLPILIGCVHIVMDMPDSRFVVCLRIVLLLGQTGFLQNTGMWAHQLVHNTIQSLPLNASVILVVILEAIVLPLNAESQSTL